MLANMQLESSITNDCDLPIRGPAVPPNPDALKFPRRPFLLNETIQILFVKLDGLPIATSG
jgi:hypothetical protein